MVGLLFPGQGTQFVGMGKDLAGASAAAARTWAEADDILGFALSRLCFEGPEDELRATANAQPAILVHSIAAHRVMSERIGRAAFAAGHSLGELSAHVAAGTLCFADGVRAVRRRGELMQQSGRDRPGTMAAILALDESAVEQACREASTAAEVCVLANYNAPGQVVVSGDVAAVERVILLVKAAGARRAIPLSVSGAFHSPLMAPAQPEFAALLDTIPFADPGIPVVSNVTGQPVREARLAGELLVRQLTAPVRWTACIATMVDGGVRSFFELGPGKVLTGLLRRIAADVEGRAIGTAADARAA